MVKSIIGVIVGYVVMFILSLAAFTSAYAVLGADQAFKPHSFRASNRWMLMTLVIQIVVGLVGGFICALIARGGKATLVLALIALVLGLLLNAAAMALKPKYPEEVRRGNVPMMEAMQKAKEPVWFPFTFPILNAAGILVGGSLKRKPATEAAA